MAEVRAWKLREQRRAAEIHLGERADHVLAKSAVVRLMERHFSMEELQALMMDLGADWENIPGDTKALKVREIVTGFERHSRFWQLVGALRRERPRVSWPVQVGE